jgi:energy-coupling factor transporter ATP-binding protein EcfA2
MRSERDWQVEPYGWWGYGWRQTERLSVVQLIAAGNFDARTAALLWLMLDARASLIVAADPPGAGKTTTLSALCAFLPATTQRVYLRGRNETFDFLGATTPARGYLLCNEISNHLPVYLWGRQVGELFALVVAGYGLGATMHAESLAEIAATLEGYPLYIPRAAVARLDLLLTLAVDYIERRPRRHLAELTLLRRDGTGDDFDSVTLAWWEAGQHVVAHAAGPPPPGIARRVGLAPEAVAAEIARRAAYLADLAARDVREYEAVQRAIAAYACREL